MSPTQNFVKSNISRLRQTRNSNWINFNSSTIYVLSIRKYNGGEVRADISVTKGGQLTPLYFDMKHLLYLYITNVFISIQNTHRKKLNYKI